MKKTNDRRGAGGETVNRDRNTSRDFMVPPSFQLPIALSSTSRRGVEGFSIRLNRSAVDTSAVLYPFPERKDFTGWARISVRKGIGSGTFEAIGLVK